MLVGKLRLNWLAASLDSCITLGLSNQSLTGRRPWLFGLHSSSIEMCLGSASGGSHQPASISPTAPDIRSIRGL